MVNAVSIKQEQEGPKFLFANTHHQTDDFSYIGWHDIVAMAENPPGEPGNAGREISSSDIREIKGQLPAIGMHTASAKTKPAVLCHNHFSALWADIDEGDRSLDWVHSKLKSAGLQNYIIYSTLRHQRVDADTGECYGNRWRVLVRLTTGAPWPQWEALQSHLANTLDSDECVSRAAQLAYLPVCGPDYEYRIVDGAPLDPAARSGFVVAAENAEKSRHKAMKDKARKAPAPARTVTPGQSSPIDAHNREYTVESLLPGYGYQRCGSKWLHPDSKSGMPGVVILDGRYHSHHSSDPLCDGHTHDAFDVFTQHQHHGDERAALIAAGDMFTDDKGITINQANQRTYMKAKDEPMAVRRKYKKSMANAVSEATPIQWEPIIRFVDDLPPVADFNLNLLPEPLRDWVKDSAELMDNAPVDFAGVTATIAAATLIGRKVGIKPKQYGEWGIVPNLWGFCCQNPSVKKTPVQNEIMRPLMAFEAEEREKYEAALADHRADLKLAKLEVEETEKLARKKLSTDKEAARDMLRKVTHDAPDEPVCKRYVMHDATVEKVAELLGDNPQGILQCRDELSGWLRSLDREDRACDRAFYLEGFNGTGSTSYDRIGRDSRFIPHCVISLLGNIQPGKLAPYIMSKKNGGGDDGLAERFQLGVYPDRPIPRRVDRAPNKAADQAAYRAFERLRDIQMGEDTYWLRFDAGGQEVFNRWYDELLLRQADAEPWFEAHLAKYASLMPSLALIYHLLDGGVGSPVSKNAAKVGAAWCQYLETHARRIYSLAYMPHAEARALLDRFDSLPSSFTATWLAGKKWAGLTASADRGTALAELVARNYLHAEVIKTDGRDRVTYYKNPNSPDDDEQ